MSLNIPAVGPTEVGLPLDPLNFAAGHVDSIAALGTAALGVGIIFYGARKCLQGIGVIG